LGNGTVLLTRIDPARRCFRWYSVSVEPTLFDPCAVVCSWGSLKTAYCRRRAIPCIGQTEAETLAGQIVRRKLRKGYRFAGGRKNVADCERDWFAGENEQHMGKNQRFDGGTRTVRGERRAVGWGKAKNRKKEGVKKSHLALIYTKNDPSCRHILRWVLFFKTRHKQNLTIVVATNIKRLNDWLNKSIIGFNPVFWFSAFPVTCLMSVNSTKFKLHRCVTIPWEEEFQSMN
jgi:hypothetical protein